MPPGCALAERPLASLTFGLAEGAGRLVLAAAAMQVKEVQRGLRREGTTDRLLDNDRLQALISLLVITEKTEEGGF